MKGGVKDEEESQEETETSADRQMVTETGRQEATCTTKNQTSEGGREDGRMDSSAWQGKKIIQVWEHKDEVGAALTVSEADITWEQTVVERWERNVHQLIKHTTKVFLIKITLLETGDSFRAKWFIYLQKFIYNYPFSLIFLSFFHH